jgi:hypothetical protein
MLKWFLRAFALVVFGSIGVSVYDYIRGGYYSLPEFNDTSYVASFNNGLRAIMVDPVVSNPIRHQGPFRYLQSITRANPDRRYIGVAMIVPKWFEDAGAICNAPKDEEKRRIEETMPDEKKANLIGARLDAVCYIEADDLRLARGLIYSVPRL